TTGSLRKRARARNHLFEHAREHLAKLGDRRQHPPAVKGPLRRPQDGAARERLKSRGVQGNGGTKRLFYGAAETPPGRMIEVLEVSAQLVVRKIDGRALHVDRIDSADHPLR